MRPMGIRAAAAATVLAICLAALPAPSKTRADTGNPGVPFRDYIRGADIALYRLDQARSSWAVNLYGNSPPTFAELCPVTGTLVFDRLDVLRGQWPRTITRVIKATSEDCVWYWDLPTGRWLLVGSGEWTDWWGFSQSGKLDGGGAGAGGPRDAPETLAGWYAAMRAPDTSTVASSLDAEDAAGRGVLLALSGAGGLLFSLRRLRDRRSGQ